MPSSLSVLAGVYRQVSIGLSHSCALTSAGRAVCWGNNALGQARPPTGAFRQITAGLHHTCALTAAGKAVCWGNNRFDQARAPNGTYQQISARAHGTCALTNAGRAVCWGDNPGQERPQAGGQHAEHHQLRSHLPLAAPRAEAAPSTELACFAPRSSSERWSLITVSVPGSSPSLQVTRVRR
jgi:hypothetical protein